MIKKYIKILLGKYNQFYLNKFKKDKLTIFAFHDVNNNASEYVNDDNLAISKDNFEIIQKMETKINNMRNKSDRVDTNITKEEEEEISKELKKLGYM